MRILLIIGGALLGLALGVGSRGLFGAAVGAFVGFVLAELAAARHRIGELEREMKAQRREAPAPAPEEAPVTRTPAGIEGALGGTVAERSVPHREREGAQTREARSPDWRARPPSEQGGPPEESRPPEEARLPREEVWVQPEETLLVRAIREYFTGGNTLVRVGVVILFIGVAFLLRYIAERTHVPIEVRLAGVALGGVVLLGLGWRLRTTRPGYALAVQGGGIGILYLTVFASLRLFHVLAPGPAFLVLVLVAGFSVALAVLQNSMAFALLGIGCGFLAPVLASTGQGDHVVLFSYYGVLNLAILGISWFKAWRPLNVVGFLFTFVIGTTWGVLRYSDELFASTEPFLIAFFLLYVAISVLFSLRQRPVLRGYVDGTLVFGTPVVAFGLQAAMVHDRPFATAYSALAVSALYLVLAAWLHRGRRESQRLLVEAFMALGIAFLTLAVPLALDGRWSAATWAFEGAALVWVGCRQGRRLARAFGALLQIASGIIFLSDLDSLAAEVPVLNSTCIGGLMIAGASVFSAHSLNRVRAELRVEELAYVPVLFAWAVLWWLGTGIAEIVRQVPEHYRDASTLVFFAATAVASSEIHHRLRLEVARVPIAGLLPVLVVFAVLTASHLSHPFAYGGWVAWPVAFATFYFLCRRHEHDVALWPARFVHTAAALLVVALVTWEFAWLVDEGVKGSGSWPAIAWALVPAIALYLVPRLTQRIAWPFAAHRETYAGLVGGALALFLALWSLISNATLRGDPFPLPYVPVLNPLDLAQALVLLVLARYGLHLYRTRDPLLDRLRPRQLLWALAALTFVWLNAILLRTLHHWGGIPFDMEALFRSTLVQTALSIFWTVLALVTMLFATRSGVRVVWIAGASLMTVVIAKLFLVDLSRVGTVERIVSFVGVGLLMLVVGYFSPLPPSRKQAA